ncbi:MAG: hypothetical protein H0U76_18350 [Ktedonobacteraceae bacterium]|nr:hypothetical protein [Ktedonobacteraceae bacterium]
MSTPLEPSSGKESQHADFMAEELVVPDGEPGSEREREKAQPGEQIATEIASSTLPPEAEGEANGGPLGCCLGVTVGLLLSLSIAVVSRLYADQLAQVFSSSLSLVVRVVMILLALIAIIVCGYFGWKIGRNAYREYDPPVIKDRRKRRQVTRSKR